MMSIIQEYSNHLEEIFENSFDYIYLHDKKGNILDVNNVVVQNLGYSKNEILNMKVTDFLLDEVPSIISDEIKKTMETGVAKKSRTYKVRKKDSTFLYIEASAIPLKKNGEFYAILGIGHDITEFKKVEQKLRESEEKYRHLFKKSPFSIAIFDSKGNLIESNRTIIKKLSEYAEEDFTGKNFLEIIPHFQNSEQLMRLFSERLKSLRKGIILDPIEFFFITKNSKKVWVHWQSSKIQIDGEIYIQVIIQDITVRKEAELNLKEQSEELSWLNTIIMLGNETISLEMFLEKTFQYIFPLMNISGGGIYLFDPSTQINTITYQKNISPDFLRLAREVKMTEEPLSKYQKMKLHICDDASIEYGAEKAERWNISSYVGIPIIARDEYKGNLNLFTSQPRTFNNKELNFFKAIGQQMGIIIKKFESEKKLKEKNIELSALNRIITLGNESTSLHEFLEKSYDQVLDIGSFDRGGVYLYNPETQHNILVLHKNVHPDFIAAVEDVDISEGLFAKVFDKNNPFYIEDFSDFMEGSKELGIYSTAIIPLRSKDKYVGSMNIGSPVYQILSRNELELLVAIGKQMGIIIQKFESEKLLKESEEKFRNLSYELEEIVNERTKELKQSEEKYRDLFSGMSNGVAVYETPDEGNTFIFKDMNPSGEKISGVKTNEIIGKNVADLFPRVKDAGLLDTFKKVYKTNTPIRHPIAFYGDETISLWTENYVYKLPTGEIVAVYDDLTALKITEQKLKKLNEELEQKVDERTKELKESEEKFRIITEQSFIGVVIEQDLDIKYVNQQFSTIIGYSTEELLNWKLTDFYDIFHPDDLDKFKEIVEKKTTDLIQDITTFQLRLFKKTGEIIWLELSSKAILYQDKPANLAFIMDITEKKEADQKIKESEEKFRNIAEQSFMGIIIIQAGELKYLNKAMANISGYPVKEMLNWSEKDMVKLIYPEDLEIVLNRLQSNIEDKMSSFSSNSFRIINRNGEVRWLEDYTTRILYKGKLANLISLVDITDKKEAEQLIIEENKRLSELYELRKDLITRVSHELKTPLTSIYGAHQILIKLYMEEIGEEAQKYIEIGHRGSLRLKQLIDNLLDVSRLDSKKFELHLQKENLVELIIDCAKDMNYLAFNRQLKMKLELPNEVYLDIDRLRFRQVLTNIISNAIKNTPSGGEIHINLIEEAGNIDIHVIDTGVGLIEKEMEKLFEKFGKIERYGMDLGVDIEGSGLGLYISKEIVELHGGQIFVESEGRNKGATFTIRLYKT